MDKSGLERNLSEHKGDVQKLSKAIATLAWTVSQREERSLEGGKNNRFPNAPAKKAATPSKVNTCLGVYFLSFSGFTNNHYVDLEIILM